MASTRKTLLILSLVIGIPLLGIAALAGAGFLLASSAKSEPVTDADKAILITADELAEHAPGITPRASLAKISKQRFFDGSHTLSYEYNFQNDPEHPLYLRCAVHVERNDREARTTYSSLGIGLKAGFAMVRGTKIEEEPHDELLKWGDESRAELLLANDKPIGNVFVTRKGSRVFHVMFSGVFFRQPSAFQELVMPKLDALEQYQP